MSSRDLEKEMSKFEAELSKLTSSSFTSSSGTHNKPKISIQMPTSFSTQLIQQQQKHAPASIPTPNASLPVSKPPPPPPPAFNPPSIPRPNAPLGGVKRDSSGKVLTNQPKPTLTPAAEAANAVAAAHVDDFKTKKAAKDKSGGANKFKNRKLLRSAGGQVWEDPSLNEWDPDDFRLFCGDLGNEVSDEALARAFQKYPSLVKARVIRDKRTGKTKGYGFVSFKNSEDFIKAMREMNGKYVGNRPIKLRKSNWKDRNLDMVKKKEAEKEKMGFR